MSSLLADAIMTPLTLCRNIHDLIRSARSDSLVEYTKVTRAEPITLVAVSLLSYPAMSDILQTLTSLYAAFYLQSIAISTNVGKVDVIKLLEKVNPNRDPIEAGGIFFEGALSAESQYQYMLPPVPTKHGVFSQESDVAEPTDSTSVNARNLEALNQSSNLSVGKVFNVDINSDGTNASIPVSVRLIVSPIDDRVIKSIMTYAERDLSVKERFYGLKSGRLKFIKDNVLCVDLIDEHRRTLMTDSSNQYQEIISRANQNRIAGLVSMNPSVATASNIWILDSQTARAVEGEIKAHLKDFKVRTRIFQKTYVMMMVIVDTEFDMVTIYFRGNALPTVLPIRDLKHTNAKGGLDVTEVLRTLQLGQSPRL